MKDFLRETGGKYSITRLFFLLITIPFHLAIIGIWIYASILLESPADIPLSVTSFSGVLLGHKIFQRGVEAIGEGRKKKAEQLDAPD